MEDLISITELNLKQHTTLKTGDSILVGVSGGPDSMALLTVLNILKSRIGFELAAAHIHHGLRLEADLDAELVRDWCGIQGVRLFEKRLDLGAEAERLSMSIEEAGRVVRRDFFAKCRSQLQLDSSGDVYVALAHHRRDQAETLILNLSRGTGLSGLAGMKFLDGFYIRPFLSVDNSQILEWLDINDIPWRTDHSNLETVYTRNRIRHMLLPCWQETIGHDPVTPIIRACDNLAMDEDCLKQIAGDVFCQVYNDKKSCISCDDLAREHAAIQIRVLREFFLFVAGTVKDLSQKHLLLMQDVLLNHAGPYDLPHGISVRQYQGKLLLEKSIDLNFDISLGCWEIPLIVPGITELPDGLGYIEARKIEYKPDFRYNSEMNCFREARSGEYLVRLRRPGDRIRPAGRQGTRSLKKFMNEEKIDPRQRDSIPVIFHGNDVVWLPGYACGDAFVCNDVDLTKAAIRLVWHRDTEV